MFMNSGFGVEGIVSLIVKDESDHIIGEEKKSLE